MLEDFTKDIAKEEFAKLNWRVTLNFNLILLYTIFAGFLAIMGWRMLKAFDEHKDFNLRITSLEAAAAKTVASNAEIKNLLLWIQSDVLVLKSSLTNAAINKNGSKVIQLPSEPPKIIYQTIVQDKEGNLYETEKTTNEPIKE